MATKKKKTKYGSSTRAKNGKRTVISAGSSKTAQMRKGNYLRRHFAPNSPGPLKTKSGKPTPRALGAARWGEPVPTTDKARAKLHAKGKRMIASAKKKGK